MGAGADGIGTFPKRVRVKKPAKAQDGYRNATIQERIGFAAWKTFSS